MVNIRPAADIPEILKLIRELAECEKLARLVAATSDDLRGDGFSGRLHIHIPIAERDAELAGYTLAPTPG